MLADIEAGKVGTVIVKDYCAIIGLNQKDLENQGILPIKIDRLIFKTVCIPDFCSFIL